MADLLMGVASKPSEPSSISNGLNWCWSIAVICSSTMNFSYDATRPRRASPPCA